MFGLEPIEILAIIASVLAIASILGNMYMCCKIKCLRQKIDSIEKIGRLAKLECPRLKAATDSKEEQAQADIVNDLISSILDAAAAPEKPVRRQLQKTDTQT
jgi:hypothetical protein